MPTTDLDPTKTDFFETNETGFYKIRNLPGNTTTHKKQTKWNYHHFICFKNNPLKISPQRTIHKTELTKPRTN